LIFKQAFKRATVRAEITTLLNRPPSQKLISEIDNLSCPIHVFMLFLDELDKEKVI